MQAKKPSFLSNDHALLTAMVQLGDPESCVTLIRNSAASGAEAFGIQLCYIEQKYKTEETYRYIFSRCGNKPIYIARAYCIEPKAMLMDEPFGALDAQTRYLMQEELQRIWQTEKRTIIFVTNNIEEALYLADRIIVLSNCPATVKKEFVIDLPRPRDYVSPEFLELRKEITSIMDSTL